MSCPHLLRLYKDQWPRHRRYRSHAQALRLNYIQRYSRWLQMLLHLNRRHSPKYLAYCRENGISPKVDTAKSVAIFFANKRHTSPGTAKIRFPINSRWLECELHLLLLFLPLLLSLQDMDRMGIYVDNLSSEVIHKATSDSAKLTRKWGHAFIIWDQHVAWHFTEQELRNMHWSFGHPSVGKLSKVLQRVTEEPTAKTTFKKC